MKALNKEEQLVVCNDSFRRYECDINILENVLRLIEKSGDIKNVYDYYAENYSREEIDDFIDILINENVIILQNEPLKKSVSIAVIGDELAFKTLEELWTDIFSYTYFETIFEYEKSEEVFDGIILLPGDMLYGEILQINRYLYNYEIPFVVCRYTGEEFIVGPLVFPWKTTCLECHSIQHLMILNEGNELATAECDVNELTYAKKYNSIQQDCELKYALHIVLQDMEKLCMEKANFLLVNKEIYLNSRTYGKIVTKSYSCTSRCKCCHAKNKNYTLLSDTANIKLPDFPDIWDGQKIKYVNGGLRSVSVEDTEKILANALDSSGLNIQIKEGMGNAVSEIIPVYHSLLETSHKNKTPYFMESQRSYGKGINPKQAYFSASFEMFERISARYFGEKEIICGKYSDLQEYCADIDALVSLHEHVDTVYDTFDATKDVDWVWGYSLIDKKPKLLPASLVFLSKDSFKGNFAPNGSSGMSAGGTLKDAILQGLFELIEHDAWMIGQANTVRLPIITYDGLKNTNLKLNIEKIKAAGFNIISRDYTNDLGIPVIRTWISNPNSFVHYATNGLGASIYPEIALERSVTEAVQSGASSIPKEVDDYSRPFMKDLISARDGLYSLFYFQQKDIRPVGIHRDIQDLPKITVESVDDALNYVISKIREVDKTTDVLYVDFTRKHINVPVVKVFVTRGLQVLREPLLSTSDRLVNFQRNMGYSELEAKYDELYMGPYPH